MEQDGLALDWRVHDLVAGVETAACAKHRVIADVLAVVANRRNRTDIDLACIWMPEGGAYPVIGQQDRLSTPRTIETAMRYGADGSFNYAIRLSRLNSTRFLLGRLSAHQKRRPPHYQDISAFIAQEFHCLHLSLTAFPGCLSGGGNLKHRVDEIRGFKALANSTNELITTELRRRVTI